MYDISHKKEIIPIFFLERNPRLFNVIQVAYRTPPPVVKMTLQGRKTETTEFSLQAKIYRRLR